MGVSWVQNGGWEHVSEFDDVLAALAASQGEGVALATVVAARGSTYRRAGARLVVRSDGELVGNISGGCLEGDVVQAAAEVLASGRPRLLHFDLTADDEVVWGWGLGCNGVIEVLVEPAATALRSVAALEAARREHRWLALVTLLDGDHVGARLVVHPDGSTEAGLSDGHLDEFARDHALMAMARGASQMLELAEYRVLRRQDPALGTRAFVEVLQPPLRLLVCGAGHDAIPLVAAGASLGWRVDVVDDRAALLTPERFPQARLLRAEPAEAAAVAAADGRTYAVVMSHNFLRDQAYLRSFLTSEVAYLGMLGPRARLHQLLHGLTREGITPSAEMLDRVYGPAGLDVGAEGPEEIAWSIIAEILAVSRGAGAGFLRERTGPIHPRRFVEALPAPAS